MSTNQTSARLPAGYLNGMVAASARFSGDFLWSSFERRLDVAVFVGEKSVRSIAWQIVRKEWWSAQRPAFASTTFLRVILCASAAVLVSGCATYPISKTLREEAKPVSSEQVVSKPNGYKGTIVIWGGRVLDTLNDSNGAAIYVLKLPLDRYEKPEADKIYAGRFIVRSKGFIDPELFRGQKLVTVAGEITGVKSARFQKIHYTYPVLALKELHIWRIARRRYYYPDYWGWYGPDWDLYGGWYGPDWDWDGDWDGDFHRDQEGDRR